MVCYTQASTITASPISNWLSYDWYQDHCPYWKIFQIDALSSSFQEKNQTDLHMLLTVDFK